MTFYGNTENILAILAQVGSRTSVYTCASAMDYIYKLNTRSATNQLPESARRHWHMAKLLDQCDSVNDPYVEGTTVVTKTRTAAKIVIEVRVGVLI